MADGVIQWIKLKLDPNAKATLIQEAADAGRKVSDALLKDLAQGNKSEQAVAAYVTKLQAAFDKYVGKLQEAVAKGLSDKATAQASADELVKTYNERLIQGIKAAAPRLTAARQASLASSLSIPGVSIGAGATTVAAALAPATSALTSFRGVIAGAFSLSALKSFAGQLGIVIGLYKALKLAQDSVVASAEQEAAWARVSIGLAEYGVKISSVTPQLKAAAEANLRLGFTNEQTADAFGTLINLTGDVGKSMKALPIVFDLMVERHMTLQNASKALGRAIVGSTENLQRQGIYLDQNRDAIDQLSARFGGSALARAQTFAGAIDRMSAMWHQLKVELGTQLTTGVGGMSFMEQLIADLRRLRQWIQDNQAAIQAFGLAVRVAFTAIAGIITALGTSMELVVATMGWVFARIQTIPVELSLGFRKFQIVVLEVFDQIAKGMDHVFNTSISTTFDRWLEAARKARKQAQGDLDVMKAATKAAIQETLGLAPTDASGNPLAPDKPQGSATVPEARMHQKLTKEISDLRKQGLTNDTEEAVKAQARLNELLDEMKQKAEDITDNAKAHAEYEAHVFQIEQALAAIRKKQSGEAAERKAQALLNREIELNGQLLAGKNQQDALTAASNLDRIQKQLLDKEKDSRLTAMQRLEVEHQLEEIQRYRDAAQEKLDKKEDDEIKRLTEMVKLNVNRQQAQDRLNALMAKYTGELQAAQAKGDLLAAERAAKRIADIEIAQHLEVDGYKARIEYLVGEMQVAETRKRATQELFALQHELEKKLTSPKTLDRQREDLQALILQIKAQLGSPVNVNELRQQATALIELSKHARTATKAVEGLATMEETLKKILETTPLTAEEEAIIKALLDRVHQVVANHPLKMGLEDFKDQLKRTFLTELPDMFQMAANSMTDHMTRAFTLMVRDARNVSHALSAIPKGTADALAEALKKKATLRSEEDFAEALTHTARGIADLFTPGMEGNAAGEFVTAGEFAAAGTAWAAIAGVAGSLQQSASTGFNNATGAASTGRNSGVDNGNLTKPDVYVWVDGVDPTNPDHQRLVGDAYREYRERYGNNVFINGVRRGG